MLMRIITTIITMVMKRGEREKYKTKEKQVIHKTVSYHPLNDAKLRSAPVPGNSPRLYTEHDILQY